MSDVEFINYEQLSCEEIPNCCGSCEKIKYNPGPMCDLRKEMICVFGICEAFKRSTELF